MYVVRWFSFLLAFLMASPVFSSSISSIEGAVLKDINQARVAHGLPPLKMVPLIANEARAHSLDMANHRVALGHDGFDKRIAHIYPHIVNPNGGAENFAFNYKTAAIVVNGWLHSPHHRQNILGHYIYTGIGVAKDIRGRLYYTQLFVKGDGIK
jgi:uncharacterized protein YkwD